MTKTLKHFFKIQQSERKELFSLKGTTFVYVLNSERHAYIFVCDICMLFIGNRFKKSICLFLNPIVELLLFCLYMSVIPIKYVYTKL